MTEGAGSRTALGHPSSLRSALRTFLIADVCGYTDFSAERGDAAAARLSERFLTLCREVITRQGGEVFGSAGDQALASFASARAALRAALVLQARLEEELAAHPELPLRAGMGLDAGEAVRVGQDYRGNAVNLAARLCAIAGAGEIFVSETVLAVAGALEGLAAVDRGEVRLKGLRNPVRVVQVAEEGALPAQLPPLQAILVVPPTNLPDAQTLFVGREQEVRTIRSLLNEPNVRLLTLTGPGGTGKTRLAVQVGTTLLQSFADGVFFCDISSVTDPAVVCSSIAAALRVKAEPGTDLELTLIDHLRSKRILLVVDNWEQVIEAAPLAGRLLDSCRYLTMLATSRVPLRLSREHEFAVPPLNVPDPRNLPDLSKLSQYDAVALFIERAQAVRVGFEITSENAPAVAEICSRLDGLPLAIELAAARIKLFPPRALLLRLSDRLSLLTGGAKDRPTRQQTLRGAIEWSFSLLTEEEHVLFARLAVFAGGCSFEAAEAVCNAEGDLDLLTGMTSLVEKSLLRQDGEEEPRFSMLETIREYALEKLTESDDQPEIFEAHARYVHRLALEAQPRLEASEQTVWMATLDAELANVRGAVHWMLDHGRVEQAVETVIALYSFWLYRGHYEEPQGWLDRALESGSALPPHVRAWALWGAATYKHWGGNHASARVNLEAGLALFRQLDDRKGIARCLYPLGIIAYEEGRYDEATATLEQALSLAQEVDDRLAVGVSTLFLGNVLLARGELEAVRSLYEAAVRIARANGDRNGVAMLLGQLGTVSLLQGRLDDAHELYSESIAIGRDVHSPRVAGSFLCGRAIVSMELGKYQQSAEDFREGLRLLYRIGHKVAIYRFLGFVGEFSLATGDLYRAARLFGAVAALGERHRVVIPEVERPTRERRVMETRERMTPEAWERAWNQGQATDFDETVDFALETVDRYADAAQQSARSE